MKVKTAYGEIEADETVSSSELFNHWGDSFDLVTRGKTLLVTRHGRAMALFLPVAPEEVLRDITGEGEDEHERHRT